MKKTRVLYLVLILIFINSVAFAAVDIFDVPENISVNDYSVVMNEDTKSHIRSSNEKLYEATQSKIIFVTVPTTGKESIDEYAHRWYDAWGVSAIGDSSSTFVLLATDDMDYWAIVGSHLSSALTRETLEKMLITYMEPDFAVRNFDGAIKNTFSAISNWYTSHYNFSQDAQTDDAAALSKESDKGSSALGIALSIILTLALIAIICYTLVRRKIRLYAVEQRKRERIQSYRKYSRRTTGGGDYEYFEFQDTSNN